MILDSGLLFLGHPVGTHQRLGLSILGVNGAGNVRERRARDLEQRRLKTNLGEFGEKSEKEQNEKNAQKPLRSRAHSTIYNLTHQSATTALPTRGVHPLKIIKGKGPTLIWRHKPRTAAAAALCVTDKASVLPIGCRLSPNTWLAAKQPYAALVCLLVVSTLVIHVIKFNYYSFTDPEGMEG